MNRPRFRTHLRGRTIGSSPSAQCGIFGFGLHVTDDPTAIDCGHCIRIRDKLPAPQKFSGKARWRAMKALAERHRDEYEQLLADALRSELEEATS